MAASFIQRAFLPSPLEEAPGRARIEAFARLRFMFTISALLVDVGIYLAFRGSPHFDQRVLEMFVLINCPPLALSAIVSWFWLRRRGQLFMPLSILCATIEMASAVVWIQLTGVLSSYFLVAIPGIALAYRLYSTYRLGLVSYLLGASLHLIAIAGEELGLLRTAGLFTSDPGAIYSEPLFRGAAVVSVQFIFLGVFILANLTARALREKETELEVVQRDLDRVVAEVKPGRLSGEVLDGKYQLGELLGRGGMGEVYQAKQIAGGALVAVKILYAHLAIPDHLERFRREASIARKLPTRHVAQVLDFGHAKSGDHHYLVLELLLGEDLGMLLRRRTKLTAEEILPIVDQLAEALELAHASGVVHRDLKPQNVFLIVGTDGPHVKLLDFGVARLIEGSDLTHSAMLLGSPGYLAPEQAVSDFGEVGPRTDVFALGAIVYRAITGGNAFPARHVSAAVYEAVHVDPPAPSHVDPTLASGLDAVLAISLAKDPKERYALPSELARDLRAAFGGTLDDAIVARAAKVSRAQPPSLALDRTLAAPSIPA